ncbi:hypothetical protein DFH06DRAFT_1486036 [Mycena polygramma]|nr:hypothetical protein DFH06DRAFT_1486036 [Mycena polygramma]
MSEHQHGREKKLPYKLPPTCDPLFTSNAVPLDSQLAEIAESSRIAQDLKASLELQITETRMELLRLEREEMYAARHIERCKLPLAPIRRIPNEILSNIFVCYADLVNSAPLHLRRCTNVHGMWILGHICAHWRAVALSTAAVWSSFFFRCGGEAGPANASAMAEQFLLRSRNHLLSIEFDCVGGRFDEISAHQHLGDVCRDIFDALLARSAQWKVAKFSIPPSLYPEMRIIRDRLPNLATFHLSLFATGEQQSLHDVDTFRSCPRLVDLNLRTLSIWDNSPQFIAFPWYQLKRYEGAASYGATNVLAQAPNIVHCVLRYGIDRPMGTRQNIVHQMRSVCIWGAAASYLEDLELPALQDISFSAHLSTPIGDLIRRSAPPLHSIIIYQFSSSSSDRIVDDILAAAPSATFLHISADRDNRNSEPEACELLFKFLAHPPELAAPPMLPMLKHLTISGIAFGDAFVRMVESRCVRNTSGMAVLESCRLESLSVASVGTTSHDDLLHLRRIEVQLGLKVTIQVDEPETRPPARMLRDFN